jgi:hypothetical protein
MKKRISFVGVTLLLLGFSVQSSPAQGKWLVGGNMGLSITTGSGFSSTDFTFGPIVEYMFGKGPAVGSEFGITTGTGTPILWDVYFKYYFNIPGSNIEESLRLRGPDTWTGILQLWRRVLPTECQRNVVHHQHSAGHTV